MSGFSDQAQTALCISEVQRSVHHQHEIIVKLLEALDRASLGSEDYLFLGWKLGEVHSDLNSLGPLLAYRFPHLPVDPTQLFPAREINQATSTDDILEILVEQLKAAEQGLEKLQAAQTAHLKELDLDTDELFAWLSNN